MTSARPERPRPTFPARLPGQTAGSGAVARPGASTPRPVPMATGVGLDSESVRAAMVRRLAARGGVDDRVLQAMRVVPRHLFVDSALANQAYEDTSLPIGLGQTISKPSVVARMISLLLQGVEGRLGRVLEVGSGCGYQAAVLAHVCQEVYSIERLRGLHDKARDNLRALRLPNVHLLFGDGMAAYPAGAPYVGIIAAAGGDALPAAWIDQLAMGGRLVAPVVTASVPTQRAAQALVLVHKTPQGVQHSVLEAVQFVPLKSGVS